LGIFFNYKATEIKLVLMLLSGDRWNFATSQKPDILDFKANYSHLSPIDLPLAPVYKSESLNKRWVELTSLSRD
jgi:hypothetical protein